MSIMIDGPALVPQGWGEFLTPVDMFNESPSWTVYGLLGTDALYPTECLPVIGFDKSDSEMLDSNNGVPYIS